MNALVHLAREWGKGPVLISTIAREENIPQKFLESILLELKNAGILISKRGKQGGYLLRRDPSDVNMAEVLRQFDGAIGLLPCVTYHYYERCAECKDEEACAIRAAFQQVRDASVEIFKQHSLKDLVEKELLLKK